MMYDGYSRRSLLGLIERRDKALNELREEVDRLRGELGRAHRDVRRLRANESTTYAIAVPGETLHYRARGLERRVVDSWEVFVESDNEEYIKARYSYLLATHSLPEGAELVQRTERIGDWAEVA